MILNYYNIMVSKQTILCSYIFLSILLGGGIENINAQEHSPKNIWNIKLGYAKYLNGVFDANNNKETTPNFRGEVSYAINKYIEIGMYIGYSKGDYVTTYLYPSYGVNANFNVLPVFFTNPPTRLNVYLTGKYGGLYGRTPRDFSKKNHYNEYGLGIGTAYYFSRHIGAYVDYSLGDYTNHIIIPNESISEKMKLRFGITFKF